MIARVSLLRRLGSGAVTVAVVILGVAGGLLLEAPASAAGSGDIQVKMATDSEFSNKSTSPLLTISDLAPGGTVTGTMQIRDASNTDGTHGITDTLGLQMINVQTSDLCGVAGPCAGSGEALADALTFDVDVTAVPPRPVRNHSVATVASLSNGVDLATKRRSGDTVTLTLSASLPRETGNAVAYGKVTFDLQLVLTPVSAGNSGGANDNRGGTGADGGGNGNPVGVASVTGSTTASSTIGHGGNGGAPAVVEVLGTSRVQAAPAAGARPADGSVLVLGQPGRSLSHTGAPIVAMSAAGAAVLLLGLALLYAARPRRPGPFSGSDA